MKKSIFVFQIIIIFLIFFIYFFKDNIYYAINKIETDKSIEEIKNESEIKKNNIDNNQDKIKNSPKDYYKSEKIILIVSLKNFDIEIKSVIKKIEDKMGPILIRQEYNKLFNGFSFEVSKDQINKMDEVRKIEEIENIEISKQYEAQGDQIENKN